jgi:molecular chaperone GrpE
VIAMTKDPARKDAPSSRKAAGGDSGSAGRDQQAAEAQADAACGAAASPGPAGAPATEPAAGQTPDVQADTEKSIDELASLQAELESAKDHALRCRAEMENFKKRLSRQVEEERRYALLSIARDLLPVLDNMHRAIQAAEGNDEARGLLAGFAMVIQQLQAILAKYDCREIEALHKPFDPHLHQAVCQQPSAEFPANTILAVVEAGYELHDRVLRPSKVVVSTSNS